MFKAHPATPTDVTAFRDAPELTRARLPDLAFVGAFVCAGTERIGREVGFPVAVIAATHDPGRHALRLAQTDHGAWIPGPSGDGPPFVRDPAWCAGFAYEQMEFDPAWLGSEPLPSGVALVGGALVAALPRGASVDDVSALLWSGLADASVATVARRPDQVRRRFATRRATLVPPRYALVAPGGMDGVVPIDDIFEFRPDDLAMLARTTALAVGSLALVVGREAPGRVGVRGKRHA